jgi:hypothetical protein
LGGSAKTEYSALIAKDSLHFQEGDVMRWFFEALIGLLVGVGQDAPSAKYPNASSMLNLFPPLTIRPSRMQRSSPVHIQLHTVRATI